MQVFTIQQIYQEDTATLPSSALSSVARARTSAGFYAKLHMVLRQITTALTQPQPFEELLSTFIALTTRTLEMDLGVLLLTDSGRDTSIPIMTQPAQLRIHSCFPHVQSNGDIVAPPDAALNDTCTEHMQSDRTVEVQPCVVDAALLEQFRTAADLGHLPRLSQTELEKLNPFKNIRYKTFLPIPLMVASDCLGLLCCYSQHLLHIGEEEQFMLCTIANHAALAIRQRQFLAIDALEQQQRIQNFIHDLLTLQPGNEMTLQQRAHLLGYDLTIPHVVAMMQLTAQQQHELAHPHTRHLHNTDVSAMMKGHVQQHYPGALIDARDTALMCLLPPGISSVDEVNAWLHTLAQQMYHEHHVCLSVGISTLCYAIGDYPRGYAQAREALEIGQRLNGHGSIHFNALGIYRYIYPFASRSPLCDAYQEQISSLAEYDRRKKTNLLDTLETYLESGADATLTAKLLHVHRNTLVQRLERIQSLCTLDLKQYTHWLSLLVALKVYRLHEQALVV